MQEDDFRRVFAQVKAENGRLHAENRILKRRLKEAEERRERPSSKRECPGCKKTYPDGPGFFPGYTDGTGSVLCGGCYACP
jgi:hypothetical protein